MRINAIAFIRLLGKIKIKLKTLKMKKLIIASVIGTLFLVSCGGNSSNSNTQTQVKVEKWYEGGSLHKAKMSEWKSASNKNKLATCGDFMATVDNTVSMDELKVRAENLKTCIDESTKGLDNMNNESVTSIASLCIKTMGY